MDRTGLRSDQEPALVVDEAELSGLETGLARLQPIPGSRMFEIGGALKVYQKEHPDGEVFDASQGDGGASLPGVPHEILEEAHRLQVDHGTGYDKPFGAPIFREAVVDQYWQLDRATGWGPANVVACQGGRDALLKAYDAVQHLGPQRRGDFVLVTRVPWISYNWGPYAVGANVLLAPGSEEDGWVLTPGRIRASVEAARRFEGRSIVLLVITSPDNPTGRSISLEEAERALTIENLCARVDLPMNRVEVRTDEGGDSFELAVAKVVLKELLMLRIYGDSGFGAGYAFDADDLMRARRNEAAAARAGLDASIEHPFDKKELTVRQLLGATLDEIRPLAAGLGYAEFLAPLDEMATGAPNPAGAMRRLLVQQIGAAPQTTPSGATVVPVELVHEWLDSRARELERDVQRIVAERLAGPESDKLAPVVRGLRRMSSERAGLPVSLRDPGPRVRLTAVEGEVGEVLELAAELIRIPSVTNCPDERLDEVLRCGRFIAGVLQDAGAEVRLFDGRRYPAVFAAFPEQAKASVTLAGHFDVVPPEPGDEQLEPRIVGEYLSGRGSADMKTVVATYMVWMKRRLRAGPPFPRCNLLLVGNEENGESEAYGTPHVLTELERTWGWQPGLMVLGERTGERGNEAFGEVCTENRGVIRLRVIAHGRRGHTGMGELPRDLLERLIEVRERLGALFTRGLTLTSEDGWHTTARFPFLNVGETGVYNITPGAGELGVEVRPIPQDDVGVLLDGLRELAVEPDLELAVEVNEAGVSCPPENPYLRALLEAVADASGAPARQGRKMAGTSARFAPGGNAVVWGQSGIGPHSRDERHNIPSIEPYVKVLDALAERLRGMDPTVS